VCQFFICAHNANNKNAKREQHATQKQHVVEPVPVPQEEAQGRKEEGSEEKEDP
jgi:hypothetical protein